MQIKKGDMLCAHHPLIHIDEAAFGPDAKEFKPKRFIGKPQLKKKVRRTMPRYIYKEKAGCSLNGFRCRELFLGMNWYGCALSRLSLVSCLSDRMSSIFCGVSKRIFANGFSFKFYTDIDPFVRKLLSRATTLQIGEGPRV